MAFKAISQLQVFKLFWSQRTACIITGGSKGLGIGDGCSLARWIQYYVVSRMEERALESAEGWKRNMSRKHFFCRRCDDGAKWEMAKLLLDYFSEEIDTLSICWIISGGNRWSTWRFCTKWWRSMSWNIGLEVPSGYRLHEKLKMHRCIHWAVRRISGLAIETPTLPARKR